MTQQAGMQPAIADQAADVELNNGSGPWGSGNGAGNRGSGPWGGSGNQRNGPLGGDGNAGKDLSNDPGRDKVADIFEEVRRRATGDRRGSGGGSGGGALGGGGSLDPLFRYWPIALFLVVAGWFATGIYTVGASDRAVVTTFGAVTGETAPGLRWRFPSPIQNHYLINVLEPRETSIGGSQALSEALMLTSDINIVDVQLTIRWLVNDPVSFLFAAEDPEAIVKVAGEAALRSVIGRTTLESVLAQGKDIVQSDVKIELQETLNNYARRSDMMGIGLGVEIDNVLLVNAQPPQQVKNAFDDVQDARQDQVGLKNEAEARRNVIIPQANAQAFELIQSAEAYKSEQESLAVGERDRFVAVLSAYNNNPKMTVQRLYIETMERILAERGAVVLDGNLGEGALPLINLPTSASTTLQ